MTAIAFAVPGAITARTGGTLYDRRVIEALPQHGVAVQHIELPEGFPSPPPADMERALALLAAVPADRPLVVDGLAFGVLPPDQVAQLRAPLVPLVHHPLAEEHGLSDPKRLYWTERTNLARARHVLVPSPHTAVLLQETYGVAEDTITVARPGTDQPIKGAAPATPPLILAVGIQVPRKGHDVLLRALAQITDLDWRAVIVGAPLDPEFAHGLKTLHTALDLKDRVLLAGEVPDAELQQLYAKASLFALATRYEGYGIVFNEALAHGLPIISCATGAVPDTVPPKAGRLVPPDAPDLFAGGLRRMLTDETQRTTCAQAANRSGKALPSWSDTAATIARALHSITQPRRVRPLIGPKILPPEAQR